ncbi:MAG: hypothetical protein ACRBDL_10105 [Alphaproteobacteria bacterium]
MLQIPDHYKVSGFQLAANGVWENAKSVDLLPSPTEHEQVFQWLSQQEEDIAIEVFFCAPNKGFFFFGIRLSSFTLYQKKQLIREILSLSTEHTLENCIAVIEQSLNSTHIISTPNEFLEIGVLNEWKTHTPYKIQRSNGENESYTSMIQHAPHFTRQYNNPVILEFAWEKPAPMWIGVPISTSQNGKHIISKEKYDIMTSTTPYL